MTKAVKVKNILIGGGNRISVQSMTNTDTMDYEATLNQLLRLEQAGCDIARIAVSSQDEVKACKNLIGKVNMPLVADIQYDYRIAIACAEAGFDKIRFNPGNIGAQNRVESVIDACKQNNCPIRIGVNLGSIDAKFARLEPSDALTKSAMEHVKILQKHNFEDIIISVKSSEVKTCIEAYRALSKETDFPLHIGITESGAGLRGIIRSIAGVGTLLNEDIGDTIRISLTGDPLEEVRVGKMLLQEIGQDTGYCKIISCPTCSRCKYELESIVKELECHTSHIKKPLKIAVMGCVVNGPGEARDADFGVAGGGEKAAIFKKGEVIKTVPVHEILNELLILLKEYL